MNTRWKTWLIRGGAAALALTAAIVVAFGNSVSGDAPDTTSPQAGGTASSTVRVSVTQAAQAPALREHRFHGVVKTATGGPVAFVNGGRIETLEVDLGDRVVQGQVLAGLERNGWRNAVRQAEAAAASAREQLEQAERDLDRVERLGSAATEEERDQRETGVATWRAQVTQAQAALREAQRQLDEATLRAPYDAVVVAVPAREGQVVAPGAPVAMLSSVDTQYEVELLVPAAVALGLTPGATLSIRPTFLPDARLTGTVQSVADHAAEPSMLFPVVVAVDASDVSVPSGTPAEVTLYLTRTSQALLLPASAVVGGPDLMPRIYAVEQGRIRVFALDDLEPTDQGMVIPPVVAVGTPVVVSGQVDLADGLAVEVIQ